MLKRSPVPADEHVHMKRSVLAALCAVVALATSGSAVRAAPASVAPTAPTKANRLVFAEEFSAPATDWATCYAWWPPGSRGCTNEGNPDELQWYRAANVATPNGSLVLTARREETTGTFRGVPKTFPYTSGMVHSRDRFAFRYGYAEFRVKLAAGHAMWPAGWLLPVDYRHRGEIDVFEGYGQHPNGIALTYHAPDGTRYRKEVGGLPDLTAGFHTFGIDWERSKLTWYLDGKPVYVVKATTPAEPMYLLANLAVAGRFVTSASQPPGTATAEFDYIRVWQR